MDKAKEQKIAKKFAKEGSCYIKVEGKVEGREMVVSGDPLIILRSAERILDRVAGLTDNTFEEAVHAVELLHDEVGGDGNIFENWESN